MLQRQKDTLLELLKSREASKRYDRNYWIPYQDFLDPADDFTAFTCENLEGKQAYVSLIERLLRADETAAVFVQVCGFEEEQNQFSVYADALVMFSRLPLPEIQRIFYEPKDIFPSDVGELAPVSPSDFVVDENGQLLSAEAISRGQAFAYYCWWD